MDRAKTLNMFDPNCMINASDDTGGVCVRAKYSIYREVKGYLEDAIRRQAEQCDSLEGIMVYLSPLGGTGGGLGINISNYLGSNFAKV